MTAKPRRRWLQFSLGTLLLFVAALCVLLAVRSNRQNNRRVAIAKIESLGGEIEYLSAWIDKKGMYVAGIKVDVPRLSLWARILGDNPATCIVAIYFRPEWKLTDADLVYVLSFSEMRILVMGSNQITDAGLLSLSSLSGLVYVVVRANRDVTEAGVAGLQKALPKCRIER